MIRPRDVPDPVEKPGAVLVVSACGTGRGGGHLFRGLALVKALRSRGKAAWLHPGDPQIPEEFLVSAEDLEGGEWSLIVLDRYRCPAGELRRWLSLGPVLGIDEGVSRRDCDFLIDLLPNTCREAPNICDPSLLFLPRRRRPSFFGTASGVRRALISFGAEDSAGLSLPAARILRTLGSAELSVTVVLGPLYEQREKTRRALEDEGAAVIDGGPDPEAFRESLADYDLLITHFGITAFEALYARLPVLLLNPGPRHEALARRGGLYSAGWGRGGCKKLSRLFRSGDPGAAAAEYGERALRRWMPGAPGDLADLVLRAAPFVHRRCPLCGNRSGCRRGLVRFPHRSYRRCSCGMVYMDRLSPPLPEYTEEYFFSRYREQYGRTYLEDFSRIQGQGERRLTFIRGLLKKSRGPDGAPGPSAKKIPRLLDIGCAYGPFLAAARNGGFEVLGLDPAKEPVRYIRENLGMNAVRGSFPDDIPGAPGEFEVITLWYVIEHFKEPRRALEALNRLLGAGGILAFSTPSFRGISRRSSLRNFLDRSPGDHWTIWDPRRCGSFLRRYGFCLKKRVITGHHPERFPLIGALLRGPAFRFFLMISRLFGLGDTFEVYAVKRAELPAAGGVHGRG
ncbi:MAG: methyltransferase domain-containing protein [Spirochaetaceae bacterium]|jgi:2-polyprenyl-3-methyl-5-hydroxy-6-metoxy-1,4-benzoquinol methylase|nr:methyltransferase domain-containing protein [Spirochaetaceae bacterium]